MIFCHSWMVTLVRTKFTLLKMYRLFHDTLEWVEMPFCLKNAEATIQKTVNFFFDDIIGQITDIYIDDIMIKMT